MRLTFLTIIAALVGVIFWADQSRTNKSETAPRPLEISAKSASLAPSGRSTVPQAPPVKRIAVAQPFHMPLARESREDFAEIATRPLFSPTRRPPSPVVPVPARPALQSRPAPPREPDLNITLLGIAIGAEGKPVALVREPKHDGSKKIRVGDQLQRWQVRKIDPMSVEFGHKAWTRRISLYPSKNNS